MHLIFKCVICNLSKCNWNLKPFEQKIISNKKFFELDFTDLGLAIEGILCRCNRWHRIWVLAVSRWCRWSGLLMSALPKARDWEGQTSDRCEGWFHLAGYCASFDGYDQAPTYPTTNAVIASFGRPPERKKYNISCSNWKPWNKTS